MNTKELVRLHPNDEGKIHPVALRRLIEWNEQVSKRVPLADFSSQDIERWLSKDELNQLQKEIEEIRRWLAKCLDDEYSIYCYSDWVNHDMEKVEESIKLVWQRKSRWVRQQQQEQEAERKRDEYAKELDVQMNNFKATLSHKKRRIRFPKDPRDFGYEFSYLLSADDKASYRRVAGDWVRELVPDDLRQFITFDHILFYRLLPYAKYSLVDGVPRLDIGFEVDLTIRAEFWLKPGKAAINGYEFDLPLVEYLVPIKLEKQVISSGSYIAPLREPNFLGYYNLVLSTDELQLDELGYEFWQTIPCVLIQGLMGGNSEPEGCIIITAYEGWTSYQVDDFDQELKIPDSFIRYLREIGNWDSLTEKGIISDKIRDSVQRAMARAKVEQLPQLGTNEGSQIVEALISLGTPKDQAKTAANDVLQNYPDLSLEEKVKLAIQLLSKEASN